MDPHMNENEDTQMYELGSHRRLRQQLTPAYPQNQIKKKKLVNFKVSFRRRLSKEEPERTRSTKSGHNTISPRQEGGKNSVTFTDGDVTIGRNLNEVSSDSHMTSRSAMSLERNANTTTKERREAFRSMGEHRYSHRSMEASLSYSRDQDFRNDSMRSCEEHSIFSNIELDNMSLSGRELHNIPENARCRGSMSEMTEDSHGSKSLNPVRSSLEENYPVNSPGHRRMSSDLSVGTKNSHLEAKYQVNSPSEHRRRSSDLGNGNSPLEPKYQVNSPPQHRRRSSDLGTVNSPPQHRRRSSDMSDGTANSPLESKYQVSAHRRNSNVSTGTRRSSNTSVENWNKIRSTTSPTGSRRPSRLDSVVDLITARRRSSLAPTIWTPSVPRSPPSPRPANFQEQEECGRGNFVISFISQATPSRHRATLRYRRMPSSLKQQAQQERDSTSKYYLTWLTKLVSNPLLSTGVLLKGLEIGVYIPVLHLREVPPDGVGGGEGRRLEASLGPECSLSQSVYEEVVSWVPELLVTCPSDPSQWARCYIVLGFMTLDGEFNPKMEQEWKYWTGALYIYCNIDDDLGLKKLTFYRRRSPRQPKLFTYLVLVEMDTVTRKNSLHLLDFVYRMKLRSMSGYISVYQGHCPESEVNIPRGEEQISAVIPEYFTDNGSLGMGKLTI